MFIPTRIITLFGLFFHSNSRLVSDDQARLLRRLSDYIISYLHCSCIFVFHLRCHHSRQFSRKIQVSYFSLDDMRMILTRNFKINFSDFQNDLLFVMCLCNWEPSHWSRCHPEPQSTSNFLHSHRALINRLRVRRN